MDYRLGTYLILEKIQEQARKSGNTEFADFINDNIQPFWSSIPLPVRKALKSPKECANLGTASIVWGDDKVVVTVDGGKDSL